MAAGGPGDHPISDVLRYGIEVYGQRGDSQLKELSQLLPDRELYDWWDADIGWQCEPEVATEKIAQRLGKARQRAKDSGWEVG